MIHVDGVHNAASQEVAEFEIGAPNELISCYIDWAMMHRTRYGVSY